MKKYFKIEKKYVYLILKWILILFSILFIYREVFINHDINLLINFYASHDIDLMPMIASLGLIVINLGLESYKWKKISSIAQKISYWQSYQSILMGASISIFTPNRVGEFGGKIILFKSNVRLKAFILAIWANYSQLVTTIIIGNIGIFYFIYSFNPWGISDILSGLLISVCSIITLLSVLIYYNPIFIYLLLLRYKKIYRYKRKIIVLNQLKSRMLNLILLLSVTRYFIFAFQYWLLLKVFGSEMSLFQGILFISVIYYVISIVPTAALSDIGVRTTVAAFVFSFAGLDPIPIMIASLVLWFFNIAIPSVVGIPLLIKTRVQ